MERFKVVKKNNKFFVENEFFGLMMIYGVKTAEPYIRKLSAKIYLSPEMIAELNELK